MKSNFSLLFFCLIIGIIFASAVYAGDDVNSIVSNLQKKYDSIQDASVTFKQNVRFGVTKSEQTFSGKLFMKRGNKYRIESEEQTLVTDGKSVWSFTKENNQVLIDKYKDDPQSFSPDKILVNVPENYYSTFLGKEKIDDIEVNIVKLVPQNDKSSTRWIKIWVDTDKWLMKKIQMQDVSDNLTTYLVEKIKLNSGLTDSVFQLDIPKDAEVIDLR
jgi:outer membrane lipoprotein carrier protein